MTKPARNNNYRSFYLPILVALISGAAIQIAGGLIWGGKLITRVDQFEREQVEQNKIIERLAERGLHQLPIIDQRLKALEDTVHRNGIRIDGLQIQATSINPLTAAQLETIRSNVARVEEQHKRIADQLDNLFRRGNK